MPLNICKFTLSPLLLVYLSIETHRNETDRTNPDKKDGKPLVLMPFNQKHL